jgi:hypothetical protein
MKLTTAKARFLSIIMAVAIALIAAACGPPQITTPPPSTTSSSAPPAREVSGDYKVTGTDANGNPQYAGALSVTNEGDGYRFRWTTNKEAHDGVGVQMGNAVAVSYARTGGGKGCGVVLYKIASDGSLDGRIARWGEYTFGVERATRNEGRNFPGKYDVKGRTADGKEYSGPLTIEKNGAGYQFDWATDKPFAAFGLQKGSVAAASFGGKQCSFMLFDIQGDGDLKGDYGGQRAVTFGKETAERQ